LNKSVVSIACSMIPMDDLVLFTSWNSIKLEIKSLCSSFTLNKPEGMTLFPRLHSYILHLQHTFEKVLILLQIGGHVMTSILLFHNWISEKTKARKRRQIINLCLNVHTTLTNLKEFLMCFSDDIGFSFIKFILPFFSLNSLHESL
jgi:hypothetical protein